jgi:hypothetical protein
MSMRDDDDEPSNSESFVDCWDAMHYSIDNKGRKNWMKIGRAWANADSDVITLKLYALPFPNLDGQAVLKLNPYDPEWKKNK